MFKSPKQAIESGWVQNIQDQTTQVQPNAIDFTLDRLYRVVPDENRDVCLLHHSKTFPALVEAPIEKLGELTGWWIQPGEYYDGMSNMFVTVPEGCVSWLKLRSTFNRMGGKLDSGFYDSGFEGNIGFSLYTQTGPIFLEEGVRIGQIIFGTSESYGTYAGGYNTQEGQHWASSRKTTKAGSFCELVDDIEMHFNYE